MPILAAAPVTPAAVAFGVAAVVTFAVRAASLAWGWVERPRTNRWHRQATARFGGIGMLAGLGAGVTYAFPAIPPQLLGLAILALGMFTVGLVDDVIGLRPQTKLVAQIGAGVLLYLVGFRFNAALPWALDFFVVVFWVVAITNAMNLLDNMDGLAAGIAVIAGVFRLLLYHADGNDAGMMASAVFAGAAAGFLVFNFSPASIFMGDCGSMLLGFVLAALNLTTKQAYAKSLVAILLFPALVLAIPIFDTTFVSVVRWFSGRRVSEGGADHPSHRLVAVGLSERQAVFVLYAISVASGLLAYRLYRVGFSYAWFAAGTCLLALVLFGIFLSSVSVYPEEQVPPGSHVDDGVPRFTLATQFMYKRAMLWILVDVLTVVLAYYGGFLLRFGHTPQWPAALQLFMASAPLAVISLLLALAAFGLYRTDWQTFSSHEARVIVAGITAGMVAQGVLLWILFDPFGAVPAVVIGWGAALLGLVGTRAAVRALAEWVRRDAERGAPVLIYGAGSGGELALRELRTNLPLGKRVVAFLDDDASRAGTLLHGVPVLGGIDALEPAVHRYHAAAIVISTRKMSDERLAAAQRVADRYGLSLYRLTIDLAPLEPIPPPAAAPVALIDASRGPARR